MEYENKHEGASKGVAGTALGLSIGAIGLNALNGGLGGILGGGRTATCNEDRPVNRYEVTLLQELAAKDGKIANLESTIYTDTKIADVYERLNAKIGVLEAQTNAQAVYNATLNGTIGCIQGQVAQLLALTKTVVPATNICPTPMPQYNSWTAPTTAA